MQVPLPSAALSYLGFSLLTPDLQCESSAITPPSLPEIEILAISALHVTNYSTDVTSPTRGQYATNITGLGFCNVTITYTHLGENDIINTTIWLPDNWNGRFMGNGGGGYATGASEHALALAANRGYSAASTDGGHSNSFSGTVETWAHISPGNVNYYLLQDFASVAVDEMARIGKVLSTSYYSSAPKYSYWNGCSTGGRQGLMNAQRYPNNYNGILAEAPAINWAKFVPAEYWPVFNMNQLGYYPSECELDGIRDVAINACDSIDGVTDGIISRPDLCQFNASSVVGQNASCSDGSTVTITLNGANVAQATWDGINSTSGKQLWYGLNHGAPLTSLAGTVCSNENTNCTAHPFQITTDWIQYFVQKNASFDLAHILHKDYDKIFHKSIQEFTSIIGTDDPDLTEFRELGGKMITYHGLADELIFPRGTEDYYSRVEALYPDVRDFYRYFEAPGVYHCGGGIGAYPGESLDALVAWVEQGIAPEILKARGSQSNGAITNLELCQWPLVSKYIGGNTTTASSYTCTSK